FCFLGHCLPPGVTMPDKKPDHSMRAKGCAAPVADEGKQSSARAADFIVRIPARFLKDPTLSADAKALRAVLGAFADGHTGRSYVRPENLGKTLGWGRCRREAAQRELVSSGWLALQRKCALRGRYGRRVYILTEPSTIARSDHSGQIEQYIH